MLPQLKDGEIFFGIFRNSRRFGREGWVLDECVRSDGFESVMLNY